MVPTCSVVIPWSNRSEIEVTIPKNHDALGAHAVEFVVVNAGGDQQRLEASLRGTGVPNVRTVELRGATFNRSLCLNTGAVAARGEYLFLLDNDIVVNGDIFSEARRVLEGGRCYVAVAQIIESNHVPAPRADGPDLSFIAELHETRELITLDGRRCAIHKVWSPRGLILGDGLVMVCRRHMFEVGGLNSRLTGWGYEDTDFQSRLQLGLGLKRVEVGRVTHLTHSASGRNAESRQRNLIACSHLYARGDYLGTLAQDAIEWQDYLPAPTD